MNIEVKTYKPGKEEVPTALWNRVKDLDDFWLKYRVSGKQEEYCDDTYTYALADGDAVCRLWDGYGKHENPIGNWGAFFTEESHRRLGIGKKVLEGWREEFKNREKKPLAFFCSAPLHLVGVYGECGFRPAFKGATHGAMYCPVGDAPETFQEFCQQYYTKTEKLIARPATLQYRNEIDCLFRFAMTEKGLSCDIGEIAFLDQVLANPSLGTAEIIFTAESRVAGWTFTPTDGKKQTLIHPLYEGMEIRF